MHSEGRLYAFMEYHIIGWSVLCSVSECALEISDNVLIASYLLSMDRPDLEESNDWFYSFLACGDFCRLLIT